ncbi:RNA recognition motif 2-domain-containing protein [Mycena crocata]|nr:RNA recognition motif 2-domain-containing protein [Mycena crocata]
MSDSPPSKSSVNGGAGLLRPDRDQPARSHPPRLQHSPSMPNIWFPPHSGPIPPRLIESSDDVFKRPLTPPSHNDNTASKPSDVREDSAVTQSDNHPRDAKAAPKEDSQLQPLAISAKNNRRRRINYDQPNVLLTPPLTPSSSIRTAGSIESSGSYNTAADSAVANLQCSTHEEDVGFTDPDTISTRFVLIRNVSRKVTSDVLQFAILRSLAASKLSMQSAAEVVSTGQQSTGTPNPHLPIIDTIKGVLLRYHESHGIAILAFYDVRQAKSAQALLSTPTTGTLADCVGQECKFSGQRGWLDCAFVTANDLAEMVGKSSFLSETQGAFLFAVQVNVNSSNANGSIYTVQFKQTVTFFLIQNSRREINVTTLIDVLKAYGGLRAFGLAQGNQQAASRKIFHVEYYDVRDSASAYSALDGQVMFGMHFSVLGRDFQSIESHPSQPLVRFEPTGQKAQIHERFLFIDTSGSLNPSVPHGSSDSPPFFYTSPPTSPARGMPPSRTPDSHSRRASNHFHESVVGPRNGHDHDAGAPVEYLYPPLDRFPLLPQPYYNGCPTPPLPTAFSYAYAPHPPQLMTSSPAFSGCPPSPLGYSYDYDQQAHAHAIMNMNMGNWAFEQAMMVPTAALGMYPALPYPAPNSPAASEYWQGSQTPSPQHTAYFHYPPLPPDSPSLSKLQPLAHPSFSHPIHQLPSPPSPVPPSRSVVPASGPQNSANSAERNQLNLARIEDGQDTRTTVMIKNIPNKMSDKDLMAYIASVCARKIDFLYLRMDFQNGCNVGYAFVNFISVQDLLRFAKAKLGEKWNMFSSEKVLQMSYANYQGKEALVEKFKNSCIMGMYHEREAWQPKIFYSDPGPEQGLPEPFPAPTHLRRKERSSYNRGPLYVPGMMSGSQASLSSQNRRQQTDEHRDHRPAPSRHNERERPRRFRDADEPSVYGLADGMASVSFAKKPSKK